MRDGRDGDIHVDDIHPDAQIQFIALDLVQEMKRRGLLVGNLPNSLMSSKERAIVRNIKRKMGSTIFFSDESIEGAILYCLQSMMDMGYVFRIDVDSALKDIKGV